MTDDRTNQAEEANVAAAQNEGEGTREKWQKPALEKLPLNEARTGTAAGSDSELFS